MTLKCLACEHENSPGDRFCAACGSSLDLQLCQACEAINGKASRHCHRCGAQLSGQSTPLVVARSPSRSRLARWLGSGAVAAVLAGSAAVAHYRYGHDLSSVIAYDFSSLIAIDAKPARNDAIVADGPKPIKRAAFPVVPAIATPPKPAIATPASPAVAGNADRAAPRPDATGETASRPAMNEKPAAAFASAGSAAGARAPRPTAAARPRVTHTRAEPWQPAEEPAEAQGAALAANAAPARATVSTPERADVRNRSPDSATNAGCTGVVVALGLCSTNAKGEGN